MTVFKRQTAFGGKTNWLTQMHTCDIVNARVDVWYDTNESDMTKKKNEWMPWRKISYISTRHGRFGWLLFEHYVNEKHLTHTYANRIWATVYGQKFIRSIVKQLHSIWHRIALLPYSFLSFIFFIFLLVLVFSACRHPYSIEQAVYNEQKQ